MRDTSDLKKELEALVLLGYKMKSDLIWKIGPIVPGTIADSPKLMEDFVEPFDDNYQHWFTLSLSVMKQLVPDRLDEFKGIYFPDPKRKIVAYTNFTISDWLMGKRFSIPSFDDGYSELNIVLASLNAQLEILKSAESRFESSLMEIKRIFHADLFDSEIEGAKELFKSGFLRAAGVVCGIVLEKHLNQVLIDRGISSQKKKPTLNDFCEELKKQEIIEIPVWRKIQHLADIRNIACHGKEKEPTSEEIEDLLTGTAKIIKTVF